MSCNHSWNCSGFKYYTQSSKKAEKRIRKECEAIIAATMDERRNASFRILDECSTSPHVESHDMEGVVDSTQDPIAKRSLASPQRNVFENKDVAMANDALQTVVKESGMKESAVSELQKSPETQIIDELEDTEFLELASRLIGENVAGNEQISHSQVSFVYCIMFLPLLQLIAPYMVI
ncbi:hypothetical protein HYC85_009701 [Camellia sinensis]|uniref:Uncharacterized protein n=1 Tax=Camellia sinensis TaxID=4442 RepID=A0A7J7HH40_CAMSI|nr:hypothetical protein HYC85_009701 [Camellia sinensis]